MALYDGEGVKLDVVFMEYFDAAHDAVEGGTLAFVDAVVVVIFFGTVDRNADQEFVYGEEFTPLVVEERAVGLEGIVDRFSVGIFFLEGNNLAKEVDAEDGRLATLPCEGNFGDALCFDVLLDVAFENFWGHFPVGLFWVEFFFFEVEAVGAVEVADGADGLCHDVEGRGCAMLVCGHEYFPGWLWLL